MQIFCLCLKSVIITILNIHGSYFDNSKILYKDIYGLRNNLSWEDMSQNAGLVDVKKDLREKSSKGIFMCENLKNEHRY